MTEIKISTLLVWIAKAAERFRKTQDEKYQSLFVRGIMYLEEWIAELRAGFESITAWDEGLETPTITTETELLNRFPRKHKRLLKREIPVQDEYIEEIKSLL